MNNIERRSREMLYISDDSVMAEQKIVRKLVQEFNTMDRSDFDGLAAQSRRFSASPKTLLSIRLSIATMAKTLNWVRTSLATTI